MKRPSDFPNIMLYRPAVDMRKQLQGLALLVEQELERDPFSRHLFVFCNRKRNLIKTLYWDETGHAMWVKKLDEKRFPWAKKEGEAAISISAEDFEWLLAGVDIFQRHKKLSYSSLT